MKLKSGRCLQHEEVRRQDDNQSVQSDQLRSQ